METQRILMRSLAFMLIASVICTVTGQQRVDTCCTSVSKAKVTDPIISFRMEHKTLPCVWSVIVETEKAEFCVDPRQPWVQRTVKDFFKTKKNKQLKPKTSTLRPTSSISEQTPLERSTEAPDGTRILDV